MNCFNCGEEIHRPAGYICEECLAEIGGEQSEMKAALQKSGAMMLSPQQAILAMLDGATLTTKEGNFVKWNFAENGFVDAETNHPWYCFSYLYFQSDKERTRSMTRLEIMAWAQSPESKGWLVNIREIGKSGLEDEWQLPCHYKYDNYEGSTDNCFSYVRAPLLPDLSGVDESKIEPLVVECHVT